MIELGIIVERAAEIAGQFGLDIDEALARWEQAGCFDGGEDAGAWLSVAFVFSRQKRTDLFAIW